MAQPAILAMVAVAATQVAMVHRIGLTPWKGGGFGMFSTVDGGGNRAVSVTLLHEGVRIECLVPLGEVDRDLVKQCMYAPSDAVMSSVVRAVEARMRLSQYGSVFDLAIETSRQRDYEALLAEQLSAMDVALTASQGEGVGLIAEASGLLVGANRLVPLRSSQVGRRLKVVRLRVLAPSFDGDTGTYRLHAIREFVP